MIERARAVDPALVIGPESGRKEHGPEAAQAQVIGWVGEKGLGLADRRSGQPTFGYELRDTLHELRISLVAPGDAFCEVVRESRCAAVGAREAAK